MKSCRGLKFILTIVLSPASSALASTETPQYKFDDALFLGSDFGHGLDRFEQHDTLTQGDYLVDIWLNGRFISRKNVLFHKKTQRVEPCLPLAFYQSVNVFPPKQPLPGTIKCLAPDQRVEGASWSFDNALLRLDISIPQAKMAHTPRYTVPQEEWVSGETLLFANYSSNLYYSQQSQGNQSKYGWLGLSAGINAGLWQFRQQSSANYSHYGHYRRSHWDNLQSWLQRPIASIESTLSLGQSYSSSPLFSSMAFTGIKLGTDQRMWPQSRQGYAPEIRGTASSAARVSISQNGRILYQNNIPQGPFVINDLPSTAWQGDLMVEIKEADGTLHRYTVPFSALPLSLRPGAWHYNAVLGKARDYSGINNDFMDFTLERGISNPLTANGGFRIGKDYHAAIVGGVWTSPLGAIGLNITGSHTKTNENRTTGGRVQFSWSRAFPETNTHIALAGYRYSTEGYRDLSDVLGERIAAKTHSDYISDTLRQRNQLTVTLNQRLGHYGSVWLSGSIMDYYGNRARNSQLQLGYANTYKQISYNFSFSRQKLFWQTPLIQNTGYLPAAKGGRTDDILTFSIAIPLNFRQQSNFLSLSSSYSQRGGTTYQSALSGTINTDNALNYSLSAGYTRPTGQTESTDWSASLQKMAPFGNVNGSYSQAKAYKQWSGGIRGAVVAHSQGVTFGPWIGNTFALVEAKGAEGARVSNGQGAKIDRNGYALLPTLIPYRYNHIQLDPRDIDGQTELQETQQRVAPYAGAAIKLSFTTRQGYALLIDIDAQPGTIPPGADVYDQQENIIGMSGQGNQIYVRVPEKRGRLAVKWGKGNVNVCTLNWVIPDGSETVPLIPLKAACLPHKGE